MNNLFNIFGFNYSNNKKQTHSLSKTKSGQMPVLIRGGARKLDFHFKKAGDPEKGPYTGVDAEMSKIVYNLFTKVGRNTPSKMYYNEIEVNFYTNHDSLIKVTFGDRKFISRGPDRSYDTDHDSESHSEATDSESDNDSFYEPTAAVTALSAATVSPSAAATASAVPSSFEIALPRIQELKLKFESETIGITTEKELQKILFQYWDKRATNSEVLISAKFSHSMVLLRNRTALGWGSNSYGESVVPIFREEVSMVSAGDDHSMLLLGCEQPICWGLNLEEQCNVPADIQQVSMISAGLNFSTALLKDGTIRCWGNNDDGQCEVPKFEKKAIMISAGFDHIIALFKDGSIECWGSDNDGQTTVPKFMMGKTAILVSAGYYISGAVLDNGKVLCWGDNGVGQSTPPDEINALKNIKGPRVISISMGYESGAAVLEDNTLICWGSKSGLKIPHWIQGNVAVVSVGVDVTVGLTNGKVVCLGRKSDSVPSFIMGKEEQFGTKCVCGKSIPNASKLCTVCSSGKSGGYNFLQYFYHCY